MFYNYFVLWCVSGSNAPLACVWDEERFYTAGSVPRNGASDLADEKPWISMPLNHNIFTIPTCITFLVVGLSTNVPFNATNRSATRMICTLGTLNHD